MTRLCAAVMLMVASRLGAQAALGREWIRIRSDMFAYVNLDSVQKIGPDAYRTVIILDQFPGIRDIHTDEVRCVEPRSARTIRYRTWGRFARGLTQDRKDPDAPFAKVTPGGDDEFAYRKVCQLAEKKFAPAAKAAPAKSPGRGSP
jgi:hypothetical protein